VSETTTSRRQSLPQASNVDWTQDNRLIAIQTPLGKDRLLLTSLVGEEAISRLFAYEIEMLSLDQAISAERLIGRSATMTIALEEGKTRPINGLVSHLRVGPLVGRDLRLYSASVVPWLWYLRHTTDCRIFQNLNVPDIIQDVFQTYGFTDFEMAVARDEYPKLEFCAQYRETAFDFVSRLMEEVGIFYFFRHEDDRHVLVIADKNIGFRPLPDQQLIYAPPGDPRSGNITQWEHNYDFRPGRWSQKDFDFQRPASDLTTMEKTVLKLCNAQTFERFDYPGRYTEKDLGSKWTRRLMEAEEAAYHSVQGSGNYRCLYAGGKFTLAGHPNEDSKKAYVIRRVRHEAVARTYLDQAEPSHYANTFEAIPHDTPFRPLRVTDRPFVHGPQTAIVAGPPGEDIFTDKYGRVRVQFPWDRYGKYDDRSSCWIRVSQSWAGQGWGGVNLPHVGHEVVVSFLEGDPDRPLVTGRVYNGVNAKSMAMPENKTQSGIKDHSGNEILMEGKSGAQDLQVHAVKDMHVTVDNDRVIHVKKHLNEIVDNGQEVTIAQGYKETITEGAVSTISDGLRSTVSDFWNSTIDGSFTESVTGAEERHVSSGSKLTVTGGSTEDITGEYKMAVTGAIKQSSTETTDIHATGAGTYTSDASLTFSVGSCGSVIELTPSSITLSIGPSSVKLDASGIAHIGPKISLNC